MATATSRVPAQHQISARADVRRRFDIGPGKGLLLGSLLLVSACGAKTSTPSPPTDHTNGSRLRAVVWRGTGDGRLVDHFRDSKEGVDCEFVADGDDFRCLPFDRNAAVFRFDYADSACTRPIVGTTLSCQVAEPPSYVTVPGAPSSGDCSSARPARVLEVGAAVAPATVYSGTGTADCTSGVRIAAFDATVLDLDRFVAASATVEKRTGSLGVRVLVGEDGSRATKGIEDLKHGGPCSPARRSDLGGAATYCALDDRLDATGQITYADAACTRPFVPVSTTCSGKPLSITVTVTDYLCPSVSAWSNESVHEAFYTLESGQCLGGDKSGDGVELGPLPAGELAPVAAALVGDGAVRALVRQSEGVTLDVASLALADGTPCSPHAGIDGKTRCFPDGFTGFSFSDRQCQKPVVWLGAGSTCDDAVPKFVLIDDATELPCGGSGPPPVAAVYRVGAAVSPHPITLYAPSGADCVEAGTPASRDGVYALEKVDETQFPELELVTE